MRKKRERGRKEKKEKKSERKEKREKGKRGKWQKKSGCSYILHATSKCPRFVSYSSVQSPPPHIKVHILHTNPFYYEICIGRCISTVLMRYN